MRPTGGRGAAAGTVVNVPLEPGTGETAWLSAVRSLVPDLAAAFRPDIVVSQHGADSHAWDPLAHLRVTTTAMGAAARLVDEVAHRHAGGRWLATGGGGYDVYRVVPRAWALTWLAAAHRDAPATTPAAWRARWADDARSHESAPPPEWFDDEPNAGLSVGPGQLAAEQLAERSVLGSERSSCPRSPRHAPTRPERGHGAASPRLSPGRQPRSRPPDRLRWSALTGAASPSWSRRGPIRASMSLTTGTQPTKIERDAMNAYFTQELTRQHQAELLRQAEHARLARLARYGGEVEFGGPVKPTSGRTRMILALGGAAAGVLATASVVLAAVH